MKLPVSWLTETDCPCISCNSLFPGHKFISDEIVFSLELKELLIAALPTL